MQLLFLSGSIFFQIGQTQLINKFIIFNQQCKALEHLEVELSCKVVQRV